MLQLKIETMIVLQYIRVFLVVGLWIGLFIGVFMGYVTIPLILAGAFLTVYLAVLAWQSRRQQREERPKAVERR